MKRALAIAVALCTLGIVGFGQITGKWTTSLVLMPDFELKETALTLDYTVSGIKITSVSTIKGTGFTSQLFKMDGTFGPFSLSGSMSFDPAKVVYTKADLTTKFDFGGIALSMKAEHWTVAAYTAAGLKFCAPQTPDQGVLRYTLEGTVAPVTVKAIFADCCTGTEFYQAVITLKDVALCCGVTYDAEFSFKKTGFDYLKLTMDDLIQLCCGISIGAEIKFTTGAKEIKLVPDFGFAEGCVTLYGDMIWDDDAWSWEGIELCGWAIECTLGDCNSISFATGNPAVQVGDVYYCPTDDKYIFVPESEDATDYCSDAELAFEGLSYYGVCPELIADYGMTSAWGFMEDELGNILGYMYWEYEALKMSFCGTGCCGNQYTTDIAIYWGDMIDIEYDTATPLLTITDIPSLFGLSRVAFDATIPLFEDFSFDLGLSYNLLYAASPNALIFGLDPLELTFGWTFTF